MGNENLEDPSGFLKHVERKISNHAKLPKEYISRLKEMSLGDEKASSLLAQYESFMKLAQLEPPSKPLII